LADTYIKAELKRIFKFICRWKNFRIVQWHIGDEHIHLYIVIPPKYSISCAIQVFKSKSANWLKKRTKRFTQGNLWARGYFASTIGIDEFAILNYIKNQEHRKVDMKNLKLFLVVVRRQDKNHQRMSWWFSFSGFCGKTKKKKTRL
jgi:putative transposase